MLKSLTSECYIGHLCLILIWSPFSRFSTFLGVVHTDFIYILRINIENLILKYQNQFKINEMRKERCGNYLRICCKEKWWKENKLGNPMLSSKTLAFISHKETVFGSPIFSPWLCWYLSFFNEFILIWPEETFAGFPNIRFILCFSARREVFC